MESKTKIIFLFLFILFFSLFSINLYAQEISQQPSDKDVCAILFEGVGCPHCAEVEALLHTKFQTNSNLIIIEYEVHSIQDNIQAMTLYKENYNIDYLIPTLILDKNMILVSSQTIEDEFINKLNEFSNNKCPLSSGQQVSFSNLNLNELPQYPTIWKNKRALKRVDITKQFDNQKLHEFLDINNPDILFEDKNYTILENKKITYSGGSKEFDNAISIDGWEFYWDGSSSLQNKECTTSEIISQADTCNEKKLTIWTTISLAAVDAVNPCEFAVLIMLLTAIMSANIGNRKKILYAGLMFSLAIFIMYFIYGLLLMKLFEVVTTIQSVQLYFYKAIAILSIILGLIQLKDFISYKPGTITTEMPLGWRGKVKQIIYKVVSPAGAFVVGIIVTLFLIPCTMGPYVIFSGIASSMALMQAIPYFLLYLIIFIAPMIIIVLLVYFGLRKTEEVNAWKEKNIRYLHLIAGLLLLTLGILLFFGII